MIVDDVKESIRAFVLTSALPGESPDNVRDDTRLMSSGILDSLGALSLFSYLEEQFGVEISERERGVDCCDRIDDICRLVLRKLASSAVSAV